MIDEIPGCGGKCEVYRTDYDVAIGRDTGKADVEVGIEPLCGIAALLKHILIAGIGVYHAGELHKLHRFEIPHAGVFLKEIDADASYGVATVGRNGGDNATIILSAW